MLQKTIRIAKTNSMNHHAKIKGRSTDQLLGTLWPRNNAKLNIDKKRSSSNYYSKYRHRYLTNECVTRLTSTQKSGLCGLVVKFCIQFVRNINIGQVFNSNFGAFTFFGAANNGGQKEQKSG